MNLNLFPILFYTKKVKYMSIMYPRIRILDPDPVKKNCESGSDQKLRIRPAPQHWLPLLADINKTQ
jgi:hypothetical protein